MARILPFQALRYDPAKVGDLAAVVAPPYDVISPAEQAALHRRHPRNVVRLDFGRARPGDRPGADRYARAADLLARWRRSGALRTDPRPGLTVVRQDYAAPDGRRRSFTGVYALLRLEDYARGVVRPHERTLSKPKADRLDLTRATRTNFSPIFLLHDDPGGSAGAWAGARARRRPDADFTTPEGQRHRVWTVDDPDEVAAYTALLARSPVYIADGHHRYETMLRYSREAPPALREAAASTLVCLAPFQQPGLMILPTHRLVHALPGFDEAGLLRSLAGDFDVAECASLKALTRALAAPKPGHAFGWVAPGALRLLSLRAKVDPLRAVPGRRSPAYKRLDVALLQSLVLEKRLGMSAESIAAQEHLLFEKDAAKAAALVAAGKAQSAFLVRATRMEQLKAVSDAHDVMPQKSTYFLPKLTTGVVLRALD